MFLTCVNGARRYRLAPEPGEPTVTLRAARRILAETKIASATYRDTEVDGVVTFEFVITTELSVSRAVNHLVELFRERHLLITVR